MTQYHKSRNYDRHVNGTWEIREVSPLPSSADHTFFPNLSSTVEGKRHVHDMLMERSPKTHPRNRRARRQHEHQMKMDAESRNQYFIEISWHPHAQVPHGAQHEIYVKNVREARKIRRYYEADVNVREVRVNKI